MTTDNAKDYTDTIADELRQLNAALQSPDNLAALFGDDVDGEELVCESSVLGEYLNRYALDMSVRVDTRGISHGATIIVTRTVGGPNCYIERDTNDGAGIVVTTYWGGEMNTRRIELDTLAGWLDELAENC